MEDTTKTKKFFEHGILKETLDFLEDLFDKCALRDKFLILGDLAYQVRDDRPLNAPQFEIGIAKKYLTKDVMSLLHEYLPGDTQFGNMAIDFEFGGEKVPVHIRVWMNEPKWAEYPDTRFYGFGDYKIPNPLEAHA